MDLTKLFSRNWGFLSETLQNELAKTTVLVAGTGLGSTFASLAARTGIGHFILADGDEVDYSNINRQAFNRHHIGQNKAEATGSIIHSINPKASVKIIHEFLDCNSLIDPVSQSDIIINTIDFDSPAFLTCTRLSRSQNKWVLFPVNLGWGGAVYVFHKNSASMKDTFGLDTDNPLEAKKAIVNHALGKQPHAYLEPIHQLFQNAEADEWPYDPQLGVATAITSALMVTITVSILEKESVRMAPDANYIDFRDLITP